jgi:Sugar transferases involved in lipopolysaccharide synthesis
VFLAIIAEIKIDSPGQAFFKQQRVTQYGKLFNIYKFRTMVETADKIGPKIAANNDARVTKVGRVLRKKRLDEIPQLLNVIKGEMTFVGTRPEVPKFVEKYTDEMMATLLLRAGVTSKTSLQYKNEEKIMQKATDMEKTYIDFILPEKMKINLKSIEEYSIPDEIKTLIMTVIKTRKKAKSYKLIETEKTEARL